MSAKSKPLCAHCGKPKPKGRGRKLCDACQAEWHHKIARRRCNRCGEPCAPRKILCESCRELAEWKRSRRHAVGRRKPCTRCGGPKGPGARRRLCDRCLRQDQQVRPCENCHKRPKRYRIAKLCEICKLEAEARVRERNRERNRLDRQKRKPKKRKITRKRQKAITENHRMAQRLRDERAGREIVPVDERTYLERYGTGRGQTMARVPVDPLLQWLTQIDDDERLAVVAERAGLSPSYVHRVRRGLYEAIAIPDADRLCIGLDLSFASIYGEAA